MTFSLKFQYGPRWTESLLKKVAPMGGRVFVLALMSVSVFAPAVGVSARTPYLDASIPVPAVERLESSALSSSLQQLHRSRYSALNQGILVETLNGSKILAELNANVPFNPA